jgi:Putative peptidoglycan binding domain
MRSSSRRTRDRARLRRTRWTVAMVLAFALVGAACGGGDDDSVSTGGTTTTNAQQASTGGSSGSDGNDVLDLQRELNTLGCEAGPLDGELGPDTLGAIRRFQSAAGLSVDGIVGPNTRTALSNAAATGTPRCPVGPPPPGPPTPTSTPGGSTPPCTEAAIRPVVTASLLAGETLVKLNEFNCAITWAVAQPTVTSSAAPSGTEVTVLMRWNGSAWQTVDQGVYCDNGSVPAAIFAKACQSH